VARYSNVLQCVPQVVCSSQPIVASLGDDVILPCHVEPPVEEEQLTVEWWRIDLPPDPRDPRSLDRYVHRYHDNQDEEDMKMPVYAGRTELLREELKHCNVSLKIINVKPSDGGLYRCFLPRLNSWRRSADIRLVMEASGLMNHCCPVEQISPLISTPCPSVGAETLWKYDEVGGLEGAAGPAWFEFMLLFILNTTNYQELVHLHSCSSCSSSLFF
uniref:Ig-like domain-containing protein n=1 Tax=Stegastes partitus TaxID=144197 RepID=A0A3B5A0B2_9TELE